MLTLLDVHAECDCGEEAYFDGSFEEDASFGRLFVHVRCPYHGTFRVARAAWDEVARNHAALAASNSTYADLGEALLSRDPERVAWFLDGSRQLLDQEKPPPVPFFRVA